MRLCTQPLYALVFDREMWRGLLASILALGISGSAIAVVLGGNVVAVTDGDTIKVLDAGKIEHVVRLSGIDAPEKKMPFGQRSKQHLSDLVYDKWVEVEGEKNDRYGRLVGKVLVNVIDANLVKVQAGMAWHYKAYEHEHEQPCRQTDLCRSTDPGGDRQARLVD